MLSFKKGLAVEEGGPPTLDSDADRPSKRRLQEHDETRLENRYRSEPTSLITNS